MADRSNVPRRVCGPSLSVIAASASYSRPDPGGAYHEPKHSALTEHVNPAGQLGNMSQFEAPKTVYNFSAGPGALPKPVLRKAADEMLDWHGSGMSVMEMSHRGKDFMAIHEEALTDLRDLLDVPANHRILFLQGGGLGENAIVPMNLFGSKPRADFV